MSAIDRPDVNNLHFHTAASGFKRGGKPRDTGAYNDDVGALCRLRVNRRAMPKETTPISPISPPRAMEE